MKKDFKRLVLASLIGALAVISGCNNKKRVGDTTTTIPSDRTEQQLQQQNSGSQPIQKYTPTDEDDLHDQYPTDSYPTDPNAPLNNRSKTQPQVPPSRTYDNGVSSPNRGQ